MEIIDVEWGMANRFKDGTIEVNKNLKENPKLYRAIMKHELGHDDTLFNWEDLKHDLVSDTKISQWEVLRFMIRHPKSLTQLLPITIAVPRIIVKTKYSKVRLISTINPLLVE